MGPDSTAIAVQLPQVECLGLAVGRYALPPFSLRAGEALCLHVHHTEPPWYDTLRPLLSGTIAHPALRFAGVVEYLQRPMPRRRWWGPLRNPRAGGWLTDDRGLSSAEAEAVLQRLSLAPEDRIGVIGWSERTMLALEACLLRPPDLLAFDTAGQNVDGIRRVFDRLTSRPAGLALVYLKTYHGGDHPCLPGAACLDLALTPEGDPLPRR
jgi:hypothetical protein